MTDNKTEPTTTPEQLQVGDKAHNNPGSEPSFGSFQSAPAPAVTTPNDTNPMDSLTKDFSALGFETPNKSIIGEDDEYDGDAVDEDTLGPFAAPGTPKETKELAMRAAASPEVVKLRKEKAVLVGYCKSLEAKLAETTNGMQGEIDHLTADVEYYKEKYRQANNDNDRNNISQKIEGIEGTVQHLLSLTQANHTNILANGSNIACVLKVTQANQSYLTEEGANLLAKYDELFQAYQAKDKEIDDNKKETMALIKQQIAELKRKEAEKDAEKEARHQVEVENKEASHQAEMVEVLHQAGKEKQEARHQAEKEKQEARHQAELNEARHQAELKEAKRLAAQEEAKRQADLESARRTQAALPKTDDYNIGDKIEFTSKLANKGPAIKFQGTIIHKTNMYLTVKMHSSGVEMKKMIKDDFKPTKIQAFDEPAPTELDSP